VSEPPNPDENRKSGFAYAAGITLFAIVAAFCGAGYLLDRWLGTDPWLLIAGIVEWLGTDPWLLIAGIVVGSAAGLFEFVRLSSKTY
jgi:F0F1-type ATP synthase assembly protein I